MPSPQTPRHRASGSVAAAARPRRREPARHLRTGPARAGAITAGIAAVAVLAPSVGLTAATVTGEVSPEDAGPLGPVVEALPWQDRAADRPLAERQRDTASRSDADRADVAQQDAVTPAAGAGTEADTAAPEDPGAGAPSTDPTGAPADRAQQPAAAPAQEPTAEAAPAPSASPEEPADTPTTAPPASAAPASPAPAPAPTATPAPAPAPAPSGPSAEAAAVVELTNAERVAAGCVPLVVDARLTAAAQLHSEDMLAQGYFDHTSLDRRSPWDRAKAQGYANPSGENIAKGQRTAEEVVRAWMDSPGHRANILSCDSREIGVGYAGGVWTQLFGRG